MVAEPLDANNKYDSLTSKGVEPENDRSPLKVVVDDAYLICPLLRVISLTLPFSVLDITLASFTDPSPVRVYAK